MDGYVRGSALYAAVGNDGNAVNELSPKTLWNLPLPHFAYDRI